MTKEEIKQLIDYVIVNYEVIIKPRFPGLGNVIKIRKKLKMPKMQSPGEDDN